MREAQKVVAVAYRRWSFTRGSNSKALTGKILFFFDGRSLMGGGRIRTVVAHGGSTVVSVRIYYNSSWRSLLHVHSLRICSPALPVGRGVIVW